MLGDSITDQAEWDELLSDLPIVNHRHPGYPTEQIASIAGSIGDAPNRPPSSSTDCSIRSPDTIVVVQTVPPRADQPDAVKATNEAIRAVAAGRGVRILELYGPFDNGAGGLRSNDTTHGVHLSAASGYRRWAALLAPEIDRLAGVADAEA